MKTTEPVLLDISPSVTTEKQNEQQSNYLKRKNEY